MESKYALEIEDISKTYKQFKLDHVSIRVPRGCIMGFVGENGAGKSTTIKLILDLIKKESGSIRVLGKDHKELSRSDYEKIGVVMDECCFPENLTIKDIEKVFTSLYHAWDHDKFKSLLKKFDLPLNKAVKEFSKGMKMKLSIAGALSHGAELLIMDEATSGLDPLVRDEILDVFLTFIEDENCSIFMSSHILSDLEKASDYICLIHKGRIMFTESKDELLEKYGVLKCSKEDFSKVDRSLVIGSRENEFGVEALVYRKQLRGIYTIDNASIEDIMLYYIRGNKK